MVRGLSLTAVQAARGAHGIAVASWQAVESARAGMNRAAQALECLKEAAARVGAARDGLDALHRQAGEVSGSASALDGVAAQARVLAINLAIEAARAGVRESGQAACMSGADNLARRAGEAAGQARSLVESWVQGASGPGEAIGACLRLLEDVHRLAGEAAQWVEKALEAATHMEEQAQQVAQAAQAAAGCVDGLLQLASVPAEGAPAGQQADAPAHLPRSTNGAGQGYY